ncbi:hypothetical protein [Paludisphaera mucosa]|uniref:Uncharacterized protein n=1 Tax=Paludisphaera mucosa TaxID=3030827 RepID=A0ABT6F8G0_9BACT|nr:hypothetical protein [Paludisphaera mucosa]MDG3003876.1 hypothetical protein [Paludisphaera mucosa]
MILRAVGMDTLLVALCWALAAAFGSDREDLAPDPEGPADAGRPWGGPSDGLRSRIRLETTPARPDDPIIVRYEIQNVDRRGRTVWHSGFWPNHRIDVTRPDGEPAPSTPAGLSLRRAFDPEGPREKNAGRNLEPGEVDAAWEPVDVRGLYALLAPGAYRIRVVYQEGRMEPVATNVLEVVLPGP